MDKLNFKDIVKLIHPDVNPDIKNASEKMTKVIEFHNDPYKLYGLAKMWGLITDKVKEDLKKMSFDEIMSLHEMNNINCSEKLMEISINMNDERKLYSLAEEWGWIKEIEVKYTIEEGKKVSVNSVEGIIVDVTEIAENLEVIVSLNGEFRKFNKLNVKDQDKNFYVLGYASEGEYISIDLKYQNNKLNRGK